MTPSIDFTPLPHAERLAALRSLLADEPYDLLIVSNPTNIRYLVGFTGSAGTLTVSAGTAILTTDGRYTSQAAHQIAEGGTDTEINVATAGATAIADALGGATTVGFDSEHLVHAQVERWRAEYEDVSLVPAADLVERLRMVKDDAEIERMGAAASIADEAFATVLPMLGRHPTEREVGLELDTAMRRLGATGPSFETIVASGPNAALPHARPSDRIIEPGELVVMDFGAVVDGYCSDMTRTQSWGAPDDRAAAVLEVVLAAQSAGVDSVRAGVAVADVDAACRDLIASHGFADAFTHGTGHGVGLDIHEGPRVSGRVGDTLSAGHVVTVEPGVYIDAECGARIEDTVVVTETGCVTLTRAPKTPVVG